MVDPREVKIGHERVFLALSDIHEGASTRSPRGELWSLHGHLELPHLRADSQVWLSETPMESNFSVFFADLAASWRGWQGARNWATYEGGLAISCEHDGLGHVKIAVELRERSSDGWLVRGDVPLDAGQLETVARDLDVFVGRPS